MGEAAFVHGYITSAWDENIEFNRRALHAFPCDRVYAFTNIFWAGSPARF